MTYGIRYWADLNLTSGYHVAARGMLRALAEHGFGPGRVRVVGTSVEDMAAAYDDEELLPYLDAERERPQDIVNIVHANLLDAGRFHTTTDRRYNVLVSAWETDRLPQHTKARTAYGDRSVVEACDLFDEIWLPKAETVQLLIDAGVAADKCTLLPHPLWTEAKPEPLGDERFRFYYVGSWDARKDVAKLLSAYYLSGWSIVDPVELVLHCPPPPGVPGHLYSEQVHEEFTALRRQAGGETAQVALLTTRRSRSWVDRFHEMGHCFVTASRGEGFCLPAAEAAAAGNILVLPEHVASPFEGYSRKQLAMSRAVSVPPLSNIRGYELGHKWWEVDVESLRSAMQRAFDGRHLVRTAADARGGARAGHSMFWDKPCEILQGRLAAIDAAVKPRLDAWA